MSRPRADDGVVDSQDLDPRRFPACELELQAFRRCGGAADGCGDDVERAVFQAAIQDRFDLRRDPESVHIPEDAQVANDAALLGDAQAGPKLRCVAAHGVKDRVP